MLALAAPLHPANRRVPRRLASAPRPPPVQTWPACARPAAPRRRTSRSTTRSLMADSGLGCTGRGRGESPAMTAPALAVSRASAGRAWELFSKMLDREIRPEERGEQQRGRDPHEGDDHRPEPDSQHAPTPAANRVLAVVLVELARLHHPYHANHGTGAPRTAPGLLEGGAHLAEHVHHARRARRGRVRRGCR